MEKLLFQLGIGTWVMDIVTAFPATAQSQITIGKTLPTNIGFIYGITSYADGVDALNQPLPSTNHSTQIYLTLQNGSTIFFEKVRLSDFQNDFAGVPNSRIQKFTPVLIPSFDLSKSYFDNPSGVVSVNVRMKFWYIQASDLPKLESKLKVTFPPAQGQSKR